LSPQPPKKRRFRVLRWTWRLTYLSVLGSIGYIAWLIYEDRHPDEQVEADPNKKTLVILGKLYTLPLRWANSIDNLLVQ
jgi:NADH:ubiquinone reductase (non-electrogenic)